MFTTIAISKICVTRAFNRLCGLDFNLPDLDAKLRVQFRHWTVSLDLYNHIHATTHDV